MTNYPTHIGTLSMTPSREFCIAVIKKRIEFASQVLEESLVPNIEESALERICEVARNCPGPALEYLSLVITEYEKKCRSGQIITEQDVKHYRFYGNEIT